MTVPNTSAPSFPGDYGLTGTSLKLPFPAGETWLSSNNPFGNSPSFYAAGGHAGYDWSTCTGAPIHAMASGYVYKVVRGHTQGSNPGPTNVPAQGNHVVIHTDGHDRPDVGFEIVYAHLAEISSVRSRARAFRARCPRQGAGSQSKE